MPPNETDETAAEETPLKDSYWLKGILATEFPPPTDEEILNGYIDYLDEKYQ